MLKPNEKKDSNSEGVNLEFFCGFLSFCYNKRFSTFFNFIKFSCTIKMMTRSPSLRQLLKYSKKINFYMLLLQWFATASMFLSCSLSTLSFTLFHNCCLLHTCFFCRLPFRLLCRRWGCDLAYTPMIVSEDFIASPYARRSEFSTNRCKIRIIEDEEKQQPLSSC